MASEAPCEHKFPAQILTPGSFENEHHFYQRALNAQIHPMVAYFLSMDIDRIINRFCHLNPAANEEELKKLLQYKPYCFRWSGADLFNVTTQEG
jgi:hypothetical protein